MFIRVVLAFLFAGLIYILPLPGPIGIDNAEACHLLCNNTEAEPPPEEEEEDPCKENCCDCQPGSCQQAGGGPPGAGFNGGSAGDPVSLRNGALRYQRVDLRVGTLFPIAIRRAYDTRTSYDSHLGLGWAFQHDRRLFKYPDGSVGLRTGCGRRNFFVETGGAYVTPRDSFQGTLSELPDGSFEFEYTDGSLDRFDADGRLVAIVSREGHTQELIYDPAGKLPLTGTSAYSVDPGEPMIVALMPRLTRIQARSADGQLTGDAVDFFYDQNTGRLMRIEASDGREVHYTHDQTPEGLTLGKLLSVQGLGNLYHEYGYDDPEHPHRVTSIQEGQNSTSVTNEYDEDGRVVRQVHGDSVLEFDYEVPLMQTRLTRKIYDDAGQLLHTAENTVWFDEAGYFEKELNPEGHEWRLIRDGNKDLIREELWENDGVNLSLARATDYTYDGQGRKLSEAIELDSGETITKTWTYDSGWKASEQVVSDADPGKIFRTEYTFIRDAQNRPVNIESVKRRNDDGSFSTTTYDYCTAADAAKPDSTCPYEGLLKSVDGPRTDVTDVTTYAYHPDTDLSGCDTSGPCHRKGNLHKVTSALGHVTEYARYDRAGRVVEMVDPNGVVTVLSYHPRGWLESQTVQDPVGTNDAITIYTYNDVGKPTRITLPDGSFIDYIYDDRNRLIETRDNLDNHIEYILDSEGNRLAENTYDPQDALKRTISRTYDALNRLETSLNAQNDVTSYTYDAAGNRTAKTDPLSVETQKDYDDLDRLTQTTQDVGGIEAETQFQYDAMSNLTEVIDPKGLSTVYKFDARSNLTELDSPDTGVTTYVYDAADNRIQQTDARLVTVDYTYDEINRLTQVEYPDSNLDVTYHYDEKDSVTGCSSSYSSGRLTRVVDASGATVYCYDHRGNVVRKDWYSTIGHVSLSVIYEHDVADRLIAITYPSGRRVEMIRDSAGRLNELALDNGPTLVSSIEHLPFGPANEYVFGNSEIQIKVHDQNYWVTDVISPALALHFRRDAVGNIDRLGTTPGAASPIEQYDYDELYRLETVEDGSSSLIEGYSHDATGNRLNKQTSSGTQVYSYPVDSHRLISVALQSRGYDDAGNMVSDANESRSYTYDDRNRLVDFNNKKESGIYQYNALGQRVYKNAPGVGFIYFAYDEMGQILGEYDLFGMPQKEYFYSDTTPVAVVDPDDSTYYVHTDHLGTPRAVTDDSGTKRWEWAFQSNPFGEQLPDEDPEDIRTDFTLNLRFPGQYFDAESGLHYNYFRDYEPHTGRYVQSDPILKPFRHLEEALWQVVRYVNKPGFRAHAYSYLEANPLIYTDAHGLGLIGWIRCIVWYSRKFNAASKECRQEAKECGWEEYYKNYYPPRMGMGEGGVALECACQKMGEKVCERWYKTCFSPGLGPVRTR